MESYARLLVPKVSVKNGQSWGVGEWLKNGDWPPKISSEIVCLCLFQKRGFLKWWYPTTMGVPTKNDHFGVFCGYHHLRKHQYCEFCYPSIPLPALSRRGGFCSLLAFAALQVGQLRAQMIAAGDIQRQARIWLNKVHACKFHLSIGIIQNLTGACSS